MSLDRVRHSMEVTVMVLLLLEGSVGRSSAEGRQPDLPLTSTSLSLLSESSEEPYLSLAGDGRRELSSAGPANGSGLPLKTIPLRDSLYVVVPMTLIYSLILVTGLVGNVSTMVVIARNSYMHTATNYYLFSLAISDLLLLLSGLPQEMYSIWIRYPYVFGDAFCFIRGLAAETSANATVLTITAFTVERYVAICHPLRSHKWSQLSRVVRGVLLIWVLALTLALPQAAQFGIVDEVNGDIVVIKGAWCSIKRVIIPHAFEISICVFFVVPMSIITGLYVLIGLKLWRSRRGPARSNQNHLTVEPTRFAANRHSQTHVIRMLVSVVVAFFVCWAPFHAQRLLAIYGQGTKSKTLVAIYDSITHISGILYFISTCINPILYHIMSNKFRQAFKDTSSQICGGRPSNGLQHRTYSAISHRSSRMGVTLQNHHGLRPHQMEHQDTCVNCRHIPSMCACRGNSNKFFRTYTAAAVDEGGNNVSTTSLHNSSPSDKEVVIALANLNSKSQGSVFETKVGKPGLGLEERLKARIGPNSKEPTGLRAFLLRSRRRRSGSGLCPSCQRASGPHSLLQRLKRHERSTCALRSCPRRASSGSTNRHILIVDKGTVRVPSQTSVNSSGRSNNSISNSSLQDLDESEYTGEELASCLAQMSQLHPV